MPRTIELIAQNLLPNEEIIYNHEVQKTGLMAKFKKDADTPFIILTTRRIITNYGKVGKGFTELMLGSIDGLKVDGTNLSEKGIANITLLSKTETIVLTNMKDPMEFRDVYHRVRNGLIGNIGKSNPSVAPSQRATSASANLSASQSIPAQAPAAPALAANSPQAQIQAQIQAAQRATQPKPVPAATQAQQAPARPASPQPAVKPAAPAQAAKPASTPASVPASSVVHKGPSAVSNSNGPSAGLAAIQAMQNKQNTIKPASPAMDKTVQMNLNIGSSTQELQSLQALKLKTETTEPAADLDLDADFYSLLDSEFQKTQSFEIKK